MSENLDGYNTPRKSTRKKKMLTKENYDNVKWDLMNFSTKNMWRYLPESTIEKVCDLLEKEIPFDSLVDYAGDNYGE